MGLPEIQSLISQLPRSEQEELLRKLTEKLRATPAFAKTDQTSSPHVIDRSKWIEKLKRLRSLTDGKGLRPTQEILDELREDRI